MSTDHIAPDSTSPAASAPTDVPDDAAAVASINGSDSVSSENGDADNGDDSDSDNGDSGSVDDVAGSYEPADGDAGHTAEVSADDDASAPEAGANSLLVREGDVAADYLETLLDIVDYDGDIDLDVENGRAIVAVVGSDLSPLVGPNGATLDALQELTRLAVQQQTGVRSRLMLDVSGHRNQRRQQLTDLATTTAKTVAESGQPVRLSPMNPFERKVVHDAISTLSGVESESEGDEPQRRVVVHPVG
jgi:spoIIIJ-associated protein